MIQSQLGDLAVKKRLKKRHKDGGGESEDEDSRIDRHELQKEGGGGLPSSPNQLLSSSPRHGRMKTFVVTFIFVPFGGLALPCPPPLHTDSQPKPHLLFQVVQPWDSETEPHCPWAGRWE